MAAARPAIADREASPIQMIDELERELTELELQELSALDAAQPPLSNGNPNLPDPKHLAAIGMTTWEISKLLRIETDALERTFARDLELGPIEAKLELMQKLHAAALTCKNASLAMFWAKSRFGIGVQSASYSSTPSYRVTDCITFERQPTA